MRMRSLVPAGVVAAALASLLVSGLVSSPAGASDPSSGTVSDSRTSRSWTGGPFVVPNVSGTVFQPPLCDVPESCDDYTLRVDTPAGYGDGHNLQIKVSWPNAAADFDVYLLTSRGRLLRSAASGSNPETIIVPPDSGTYTVRVVPFSPLAQSYKATATLVSKPAGSPTSTATAPGFRNYAAPSRLPWHNDAGEPSIGTDWNTDAAFYQAYLATYKVRFDDSVRPARASWSDVSANALDGCPVGSTESLDPILFTDHETGRTFESQLSGVDSLTCYTDDGGKTWLPSTGGGIPSGVDHQTLGGGNFSRSGVGGIGVYDNAVYYCSQDIATALCAVSRDGGTTFGPGVPVYSLLDCEGLHGHIKVARDGTAYLPNKGCGGTQGLVVSKDNGTTWQVHNVRGTTPGDSDPSVGVGSNGTVYFGYVGADGVPGVATSRDSGQTWQYNQQVGRPFGIKNAVFPAVVAGDDGRAAFAYLGTPTDGNYQDINRFRGVWHLYISYTYDGGRTWVTSDATPRDPVQRGSICTSGTTCGPDRNLLDFMDATIDDHGRVLVGYADGCINTCVTGGYNSRSAYATIARQSSGKPLFARYDAAPSLRISSMSLASDGRRVTDTVRVVNSGTRTARDVAVRVFDGARAVGTTAPMTLQPGQAVTSRVTWTASSGGLRSVTSVVDPANVVAEWDEGDNKARRSITLP